jgi:hypothetical protein
MIEIICILYGRSCYFKGIVLPPKKWGSGGVPIDRPSYTIANISFIQIHLRATLEQTISEYTVEEVPI